MKITYGCISTSHSMIKSIVSSYIHNICVSHYDIVKELVLLVKYADRYKMLGTKFELLWTNFGPAASA